MFSRIVLLFRQTQFFPYFITNLNYIILFVQLYSHLIFKYLHFKIYIYYHLYFEMMIASTMYVLHSPNIIFDRIYRKLRKDAII